MNEKLITQLIQMLIGDQSQEKRKEETQKRNAFSEWIGKYCIVRTRNEGVNAGYVKHAEKGLCVLEQARRLYYHKPIDENLSWYEGVAKVGLHKDSKVSNPVLKVISEDFSLTVCSEEAKESIKEFKTNEQR